MVVRVSDVAHKPVVSFTTNYDIYIQSMKLIFAHCISYFKLNL